MARLPRPKKGKAYKIKFHDHAIGDEGAKVCEIHGWFVRGDKKQYLFTWWKLHNEDGSIDVDNMEIVGIVRSTILELVEV